MDVLVVESRGANLPEGTASLLGDIGWHVKTASDFRAAAAAARDGVLDAVIFCEPGPDAPADGRSAFEDFLSLINTRRIAGVMMSDRASPANPSSGGSLVDVVDRRIPPAELRGRLAMVERYHGMLRRVEEELHTMERLSTRLGHHFREVDEELRLAARLQRDFLPKLDQPFGRLRFAAIYRPVSWVSGDIYDVFRIDDEHTAMYLVDAVGHGMAAGLLTMFIKRAIVPTSDRGDVLAPSRVLAALNDALADQALPQCQFVTGCYAVFHHPSGELRYARGGHPYPFVFSPDGAMRELDAPGGLLGIMKGETFDDGRVALRAGDKVLFYSDGVELAFHAECDGATAMRRALADAARGSLAEMFDGLQQPLDDGIRASEPGDDVTLLGFEVLG